MITTRSDFRGGSTDRRALLARPRRGCDRRGRRGRGAGCVRAQRLDLSLERCSDIDGTRRVVRPEEVEPADGVRREARRASDGNAIGFRAAGYTASTAAIPAARWSVWLTPPSPWNSVSGSVARTASGRKVRISRTSMLAQGEVVGQGAVRLVEEGHTGIADDGRRGALLALAQRGQLERIGVGILAALVPARAAHQPADRPCVDPARGGPRRPEFGVIGVGDDDHDDRAARRGPRLERRRGAGRRDPWHARTPLRGTNPRATLRAEASLVSPHERSLVIPRVARARHPAALRSSSAASTSAAWPSGLTFGQTRAIRPSGSTRNVVRAVPHVRLAVVLLLDPRAVGLGDLVLLVGKERERQLELLAERPLARRALRADAPHVRAALDDRLVGVAELARLDGAARACRPSGRSRGSSSGRAGPRADGPCPSHRGGRSPGRRVTDVGHAHPESVAGVSMTRSRPRRRTNEASTRVRTFDRPRVRPTSSVSSRAGRQARRS